MDSATEKVYDAVVSKFTAKKTGKFSNELFTKDLIQFAAKNRTVAALIEERVSVEKVVNHALRARFEVIAGLKRNEMLSCEQIEEIIAALATCARNPLSGIRAHIKSMKGRTRARRK
jgi:hypothetical protein